MQPDDGGQQAHAHDEDGRRESQRFRDVRPSTVALLGARHPDLSIERQILGPLGARLVVGAGDSDDAIAAVAGEADVIIVGSRPRLGAAVLRRLRCAAIVRSGVGVDSIDLAAARARGICVAHVPDYGTEAVAQHTLALVLAATRRLVEADQLVRGGGWDIGGLRPLQLPSELTAGVVGVGRIGARVAELLAAVGFGRVLAHDTADITPPAGVVATSLDDLVAASDVVCLHVPATSSDPPLFDRGLLQRMRRGSVLVNTARGSLVDPAALAAALAAGAPRIAALDVHDPEPPDLTVFHGVADRLILTPHMAWHTEQTEAELRRQAAQAARAVLRGHAPRHVVVAPDGALPREDR